MKKCAASIAVLFENISLVYECIYMSVCLCLCTVSSIFFALHAYVARIR